MSDSNEGPVKCGEPREGLIHDATVEPNEHEEDYACDGEEPSPMSPGMRKMMKENDEDELRSTCDRVTNVFAVAILFMILITAIISIAAGACCLASLSGKPFHHFPLFFAFGVTPVVLGCIFLVGVVFVLFFIACCAMGFKHYGMCCYGATRCRGCLRVCLLGIFPAIIFIILLAMCILGFTFYSLSQQLPPLDKNYTEVAGLSGPISIARDEYGLPHIKASTRRDAYFGQGFAAAQDRLFQLEFHRLVANGNLSSAVGKDGNTPDTGMRTLNVRDAGEQLCEDTEPELLDFIQAYADGVNLYLERVSKRPVEFFFMSEKALFFRDPVPFEPKHLCQTMRLFQYQMSSNANQEGARFKVWAGTGRSYADTELVFPTYTTEQHTILNQEQADSVVTELNADPTTAALVTEGLARNSAGATGTAAMEKAIYDNLLTVVRSSLLHVNPQTLRSTSEVREDLMQSLDNIITNRFYHVEKDVTRSREFANKFLDASNAWVARDASDNVVLASDPHLTINLPSIWYWVHLSFPTEAYEPYDAAGVSLLGIPGVHIGRTTYLAWGITMSKTDLEDLFILPPSTFSGLPAGSYRYDNAVRVVKPRRERIKVKGKKEIVLELDDTVFGPIVSTMLGFPEALQVAFYAVFLRRHDNESMSTILNTTNPNIDTAEKMMHNLLGLHAPGFSIPIGDIHGNIAYAVTGRHPFRPLGHSGKFPTVVFNGPAIMQEIVNLTGGAAPTSEQLAYLPQLLAKHGAWKSFVSSNPMETADEYIPGIANPHLHLAAGTGAAHISAANQKIVPEGYPFYLGADYSIAWRGQRLQEMLDAVTDYASVDVHKEIQMDHRSNIFMYDFKPLLQRADFASGIANDANAKYWSDRLLKWDGMATIGNVEAAFFWRWVQRMAGLPQDAVAASSLPSWDPANGYLRRMFPADGSTPAAMVNKYCAATIGDSTNPNPCLQFGINTFIAQAGAGGGFDEEWGKDLNRMTGVHEMVSKKIIAPVFQRTMNKGGDFTSLAVSTNSVNDDMNSTHASSVRQIFDLTGEDKEFIHLMFPGGASGNPYSKYYQNLWDLFEQEIFVKVACSTTSLQTMEAAHYQELSQ
ncbi:Penicillin amidase, putative [Angomonas deanei]|uniref:Penicillin amidase, putative n=1 Tax=Angomonas deanei TaxID=59799 RepID=A0A7G2C8P9_9TRYP|nr:Penicillin amidase, putative [Angomonas deanei]